MQPDSHRETTSRNAAAHSKVPLTQEISLACRELHGALNRVILSAFPHGVPPQAQTPAAFAQGLSAFCGTPYFTFERALDALNALSGAEAEYLSSNSDATDAELQDLRSRRRHRKQVTKFLVSLRPQGLGRTPRLIQDLLWLDIDPHREPMPGSAEDVYKQHIIAATMERPHLLTSYAWTMYMAIFAGGRQIRQELASFPDSFWDANHQVSPPRVRTALDRPGFSFLSFDGSDDGAEIYRQFRAAMDEADAIFTIQERKEIIQEAQDIFKYGIDIVRQLDQQRSAISESGDAVITVDNSSITPHSFNVDDKAQFSGLKAMNDVSQVEAHEWQKHQQQSAECHLAGCHAHGIHKRLAMSLWIRSMIWACLLLYAYVTVCYFRGTSIC